MSPRRERVRRTRRDPLPPRGSHGSGLLSVLAIVLPAAAIVSIGIALMVVLDLQPGAGRSAIAEPSPVTGENPMVALPEFVTAAPVDTQAAYRFALENPDALTYIPCYCGCGGTIEHKSLRDCFLRQVGENIVEFDSHGSGCDVCVNIALDVEEQLAQGKSLREVRDYIDAQYSSVGPGTDTPMPPE